jgi:hypothetical protein
LANRRRKLIERGEHNKIKARAFREMCVRACDALLPFDYYQIVTRNFSILQERIPYTHCQEEVPKRIICINNRRRGPDLFGQKGVIVVDE